MNWIGIIIGLLKVITVIVALLIVFVVLLQRPKNEGLGAAFGGDTASNIFGAQTSNVLATLTRWLGGIFLTMCLTISILGKYDKDRVSKIGEFVAQKKSEKAEVEKQKEAKKAAEEAAAKAATDAALKPDAVKPDAAKPELPAATSTPVPAPTPEAAKPTETPAPTAPEPKPAEPAPTPEAAK